MGISTASGTPTGGVSNAPAHTSEMVSCVSFRSRDLCVRSVGGFEGSSGEFAFPTRERDDDSRRLVRWIRTARARLGRRCFAARAESGGTARVTHLRGVESRVEVDLEDGDDGGGARGAAFAEGVADVAGEPLRVRRGASLLLVSLLLRLGLALGVLPGVDVDDAHPGTLRGGCAEGGHARLLRAREVEHEDVVRVVHEVHRAPLEQPAVRVELRLAGERHQHAFATLGRRGSGQGPPSSRVKRGDEREWKARASARFLW